MMGQGNSQSPGGRPQIVGHFGGSRLRLNAVHGDAKGLARDAEVEGAATEERFGRLDLGCRHWVSSPDRAATSRGR
jgi:hypothetical protein